MSTRAVAGSVALLGGAVAGRRSGGIVAPRRIEERRTVRAMAEGSGGVGTVETSARSSGLALMLDDGTKESHSMANNSAFVAGFFRGIAERHQFAQMVTSFYFVYRAMEEAFDRTNNPRVKSLDSSALRRLASLEMDMEFFFGPDWRQEVKPSAATQTYVARILQVAEEDSDLLIAHQYTRYLGDLFGGQMMSGMATRSLQLPAGKGVQFYAFDDINNIKAFIEQWYTSLNALDLCEEKKAAIVDEANKVFLLNILVLEELEGNALLVAMKLAWTAFKEKIGLA